MRLAISSQAREYLHQRGSKVSLYSTPGGGG